MAKKSPSRSILSAEAKKSLAADRARLDKLIAKAKLSKHRDALHALARPSIRFLTTKAKKTALGVGASRFGGTPDLPPKTKWPKKGDHSLAFIAQVRCADLAAHDEAGLLPSSGLLSCFLMGTPDSDEYGSCGAVLYFDEAAMKTLVPTKAPEGEERDFDPKNVMTISFRAELSLPPVEGTAIAALRKKMTDEEHQAYWDEVWLDFQEDGPFHRLLGYADMNFSYEKKDEELLFQIDSDDDADWEFGDAESGRIYITSKALAARDFKKVRATSGEE